jgi:hypothetical protein
MNEKRENNRKNQWIKEMVLWKDQQAWLTKKKKKRGKTQITIIRNEIPKRSLQTIRHHCGELLCPCFFSHSHFLLLSHLHKEQGNTTSMWQDTSIEATVTWVNWARPCLARSMGSYSPSHHLSSPPFPGVLALSPFGLVIVFPVEDYTGKRHFYLFIFVPLTVSALPIK